MTLDELNTDAKSTHLPMGNEHSIWGPGLLNVQGNNVWNCQFVENTVDINPGSSDYILETSKVDVLGLLSGHVTDAPRYRIEVKIVDLWDVTSEDAAEESLLENGDDHAAAWQKGMELLADAIAEAKEDGFHGPAGKVIVNAGKMFGKVEDLVKSHDVESVVTDDGDALTYITDARKNYVMFNCTALNEVGVHFNIRSHQVFDSSDSVPEDFIRPLVSSLKNEPATF